nr:uncharacterized protein LOC117864920 [Setaria viridis]
MESWEDKVRRFMLEKEEEDDELFLVTVPALQQCLYEEKRSEHTSTLPGAEKRGITTTQMNCNQMKEPPYETKLLFRCGLPVINSHVNGKGYVEPAMSTERATWSYAYEKGLVDILKELVNIPIFKRKRREEDYSIEKCIDIVNAMERLSDEQKVDANEVFQSETIRKILVGAKNQVSG